MILFREVWRTRIKPECIVYAKNTQDVLKIRIEDIFSNVKKDKALFDTSEYSSNQFMFSTRNKKVFGKMKHEINDIPIEEFGWSLT